MEISECIAELDLYWILIEERQSVLDVLMM